MAGPGPVCDTDAMIAGMDPALLPGEVGFASFPGEVPAALAEARALVREAEGVTLVLPLGHPALPAGALAMRQITLRVASALDGVGLTAAVATALAERDIPCNVIAGYHHDHLFVPAERAEEALEVLRRRAAR
jgi:hypothetical protein